MFVKLCFYVAKHNPYMYHCYTYRQLIMIIKMFSLFISNKTDRKMHEIDEQG